jgi:hypothetical protein
VEKKMSETRHPFEVEFHGTTFGLDPEDKLHVAFYEAHWQYKSARSRLAEALASVQYRAESARKAVEDEESVNSLGIFQSAASQADIYGSQYMAAAETVVKMARLAGFQV